MFHSLDANNRPTNAWWEVMLVEVPDLGHGPTVTLLQYVQRLARPSMR